MVHETGSIGRVATKPTQAQEDTVNAGMVRWMLQGTKFQLKRKYSVDAYEEQKEKVDAIVKLLPKDFKAGMENWGGDIYEHISDTNFGLLLHDMIQQKPCIVYSTDLDGDRLTDLLADVSDPLRKFGQIVLDYVSKEVGKDGGAKKDMNKLWTEMGYTTGNGRDMTSVMHRMSGPPIHEQTLGSADAMLLRLLDGDESMGGTKQPYDPRIHFVLIRDAYIDANPGNDKLKAWLDQALAAFDEVYGGKRPGFLDGYKALKAAIKPWGA
jgi:hypothetical protein